MARLHVAEMNAISLTLMGQAMSVGQLPAITEQYINYSGGVTASAAFTSITKFVRVQSDVRCAVVVGAPGVVATVQNMPLGADEAEYFGVAAGQVISVIANP